MKRMLDLFCGRLGWSKAFLANGWECVGVDLVEPDWEQVWSGYPTNQTQPFSFFRGDVCDIRQRGGYKDSPNHLAMYFTEYQYDDLGEFDFICASSPCEEFSVHGMKHFHPNPKYPENGIRLFNHTRALCEASGVPWVMDNVRAAQQFVGRAVHHCGPFYLWGTGVPALLHQGINKVGRFHGMPGALMEREIKNGKTRKQARNDYQRQVRGLAGSDEGCAAFAATIPPELANCVADYAERLLEVAVTKG